MRGLPGPCAAGGPPDPRALAARLARPAQWWTSRLAAIAATLTHAAINGLRREIGRSA